MWCEISRATKTKKLKASRIFIAWNSFQNASHSLYNNKSLNTLLAFRKKSMLHYAITNQHEKSQQPFIQLNKKNIVHRSHQEFLLQTVISYQEASSKTNCHLHYTSRRIHSVTTQLFFLSAKALKNLTSPPRQTNSPGNCNMLHMFNNNVYTDFRTAKKYVLISNYVIRVI